jgi:hypothetical protein
VRTQAAPALYYPPLAAIEQLKEHRPGRTLGLYCLPPVLNSMLGTRDLRGYDAVDPMRYLQVLFLAAPPRVAQTSPPHCRTQYYVPIMKPAAEQGVQVPPVLDMLGLRYLIMRVPLTGATSMIEAQGYSIYENKRALPRAYVPRRVEQLVNDDDILERLSRADFDPAETVYLERGADAMQAGSGTAEIASEVPGRVTLAVDMQSPGIVVLADLWTAGWQAFVNDEPAPVWRANYVLRAVPVPAGKSTLVFRYEPESVSNGFRLLGAGLLIVAVWSAAIWRKQRAGVVPA